MSKEKNLLNDDEHTMEEGFVDVQRFSDPQQDPIVAEACYSAESFLDSFRGEQGVYMIKELIELSEDPQEVLIKNIRKAANIFLEQASEAISTQLAEVGEKLATLSKKVCKTIEEKVSHVFETVVKCAGKMIKDPILKKFVDSINKFVDKCVEKTKSVFTEGKKVIGDFTKKLNEERGQVAKGASGPAVS